MLGDDSLTDSFLLPRVGTSYPLGELIRLRIRVSDFIAVELKGNPYHSWYECDECNQNRRFVISHSWKPINENIEHFTASGRGGSLASGHPAVLVLVDWSRFRTQYLA